MPIGQWRASGSSVSEPGGLVAQASGRPERPLRGQHRPMRAGKACVDRLPHAETCWVRALRDGLRGESPRVTEWSSESEVGKARHRAQGHRWRTRAGEGGVRPVILKRRIVPTGEPCNTETVPHGSVGGRGKRSKLPRPRPTQSSYFAPAFGSSSGLALI
jgi:hypothetical protein